MISPYIGTCVHTYIPYIHTCIASNSVFFCPYRLIFLDLLEHCSLSTDGDYRGFAYGKKMKTFVLNLFCFELDINEAKHISV